MKRFLIGAGLVSFAAFAAPPARALDGLTISLDLGPPYFYGYYSFPVEPYYFYMPYYMPPDFIPAPRGINGPTYVYPPDVKISPMPAGPSDPCRRVQITINGAPATGTACPQADGSWRFVQ
ncbi:MAG: hypothetical protein PHW76_06930 [Alphaproteobacteria bacterium]|nr:hypothetical protein [Alphaproteobacteria bacterium]